MKRKQKEPTTAKEIELLTVKRKGRYNNQGESHYTEHVAFNGGLFRWFDNDDAVYLFTKDFKLKHVGYAYNTKQFIDVIVRYNEEKEKKKALNRASLLHYKNNL